MNEQASGIHEPEDNDCKDEISHSITRDKIVDLLNQAELNQQQGKYILACDYAQKALDLSREINNIILEVKCLDFLGETYYTLGDLAEAYLCHKRALFICQESADRSGEAHCLWQLGRITRLLGRSQEALHHLETSLQIYKTLDN